MLLLTILSILFVICFKYVDMPKNDEEKRLKRKRMSWRGLGYRGNANMFKYKSPKGIRIGCGLDDAKAEFGLKLQTDVAITMPQYLGKFIADGDLVPSKLRVVICDEAGLNLEETSADDLASLFDSL